MMAVAISGDARNRRAVAFQGRRRRAELPAEWIDQLRTLNPRYVVPSSCQFLQEAWSWYNHALFPLTYRQFQQAVEAALPDARVVRLNPSVSFILDGRSLQAAPPLDWVLPVGEQDVDYQFDQHAQAPHTAEIACRFAPLTAAQDRTGDAILPVGFAETISEMELAPDSFFEKCAFGDYPPTTIPERPRNLPIGSKATPSSTPAPKRP
jgi:hypothetical protein